MSPDTATVFAATLAALLPLHNLADHVTQTDTMARHKADPGRKGWAANLRHITAYHLTIAPVLALLDLVLHLGYRPLGAILALTWSAGTHALLDRRWPVRWILIRLRAGAFADLAGNGMNGQYLCDQALHSVALLIAALTLTAVH
jgi:hypothetical protein